MRKALSKEQSNTLRTEQNVLMMILSMQKRELQTNPFEKLPQSIC
jgi:hypothetical protein